MCLIVLAWVHLNISKSTFNILNPCLIIFTQVFYAFHKYFLNPNYDAKHYLGDGNMPLNKPGLPFLISEDKHKNIGK